MAVPARRDVDLQEEVNPRLDVEFFEKKWREEESENFRLQIKLIAAQDEAKHELVQSQANFMKYIKLKDAIEEFDNRWMPRADQ